MRLTTILLTVCLGVVLPAADHEILLERAASDDAHVVPALIVGSAALPALNGAEAVALADDLGELARRVFASPERFGSDQRLAVREHVVASGEIPSRIMKRYALSDPALKLLNPDYDDRRLGVGQRLKVVDCSGVDLVVLVQRSAYRCWVLGRFPAVEHLVLVATYPVGVGAEHSPTPLGTSRIGTKARDMEWTHPDTGEVIPPGDPRNILGGYWMAVEPGADGTFKGIGFHGYTGAPSDDWLGKQDSHGCLRLLQPDIHALYAWVPKGTKVIIRE